MFICFDPEIPILTGYLKKIFSKCARMFTTMLIVITRNEQKRPLVRDQFNKLTLHTKDCNTAMKDVCVY